MGCKIWASTFPTSVGQCIKQDRRGAVYASCLWCSSWIKYIFCVLIIIYNKRIPTNLTVHDLNWFTIYSGGHTNPQPCLRWTEVFEFGKQLKKKQKNNWKLLHALITRYAMSDVSQVNLNVPFHPRHRKKTDHIQHSITRKINRRAFSIKPAQ